MAETGMTMTRDQAAALRGAWDADARLLSRKPRHELAAIHRSELAARGGQILTGGPVSKSELLTAILNLRFPPERQHEAIHTLHHQPGENWSACQWCTCQETWMEGPFLAQCGQAPGHEGGHQRREQASVGAE